MKKLGKWKFLLFGVLLFVFSQCSNSGNNRTGQACRNKCIADQSLCYIIANQGANQQSYGNNIACQFLFVSCVSDCNTGTRYVSSSRNSSTRSSGSSGGGRSSSGGGSSGGGSSGGGSSGGGHGGGGH